MKPVPTILSCLLILSGPSFANQYTQPNGSKIPVKDNAAHTLQDRGGTAIGSISEKVLQTFKKTFPDAQEVQWKESADRYIVNFKTANIVSVIEYDKDGEFVSSIRYYSESKLPANIAAKLRKKYPERKVVGVTEKTFESEVWYYIKLEDAVSCITVKSNVDGNMVIMEKFKKPSE